MRSRELRAIRGAITVDADEPDLVHAATRELLETIVARNALADADLVSALFTVTPDLTSAFPACAARALGWIDVPLLCALEIPVPAVRARPPPRRLRPPPVGDGARLPARRGGAAAGARGVGTASRAVGCTRYVAG